MNLRELSSAFLARAARSLAPKAIAAGEPLAGARALAAAERATLFTRPPPPRPIPMPGSAKMLRPFRNTEGGAEGLFLRMLGSAKMLLLPTMVLTAFLGLLTWKMLFPPEKTEGAFLGLLTWKMLFPPEKTEGALWMARKRLAAREDIFFFS